MEKVVPIDQIQETLKPLRSCGKTVVSLNGCFDLIHAGHVQILREAKKQGDILVLGLNSDQSVRALKGSDRPILPEKDRVSILGAFEMVDFVVLFDEPDCLRFVSQVKPDVHVNDASYGTNCIEAEVVRECGGRLHLFRKTGTMSTTEIISKIKRLD